MVGRIELDALREDLGVDDRGESRRSRLSGRPFFGVLTFGLTSALTRLHNVAHHRALRPPPPTGLDLRSYMWVSASRARDTPSHPRGLVRRRITLQVKPPLTPSLPDNGDALERAQRFVRGRARRPAKLSRWRDEGWNVASAALWFPRDLRTLGSKSSCVMNGLRFASGDPFGRPGRQRRAVSRASELQRTWQVGRKQQKWRAGCRFRG
jgi:hypothetical protein